MKLRCYFCKNPFLLICGILIWLYPFLCFAEGLSPLEISEERREDIAQEPKDSWVKQFNLMRDEFEKKYGTGFAFLTNYCQQLVLHNEDREGRSYYLWYSWLEIYQRLWKGSRLFLQLEGGNKKGIDGFISTYSKFNSNSGDYAHPYVPALYFEQKLFGDIVTIEAGKLDLSNWFDNNKVANSADTQFLSTALVNNYVIPFPQKGIGGMVKFSPYEQVYFQSGAGTADAHSTKIGISDAFNSTLFLNELGFSPKIGNQQGNYRFLLFILRKNAALISDAFRSKKNQLGFAISFDQEVSERITLFARFGYDDPKINEIEYAWSSGVECREPIGGRKNDYCAFGVAQNILGRDYRRYSGLSNIASRETILEGYYSFYINEFLSVTLDMQTVLEPLADKGADNPLAASARFLVVF